MTEEMGVDWGLGSFLGQRSSFYTPCPLKGEKCSRIVEPKGVCEHSGCMGKRYRRELRITTL